jgi:hypothetical protein
MVDDEENEDEDLPFTDVSEPEEEKKQYYDKDGNPVSMYEILGRQGEFTSKADRISAKSVYEAKKAIGRKAAQGDVAAAKLLFQMFKEQQREKGLKSTNKKIDLGFGKST